MRSSFASLLAHYRNNLPQLVGFKYTFEGQRLHFTYEGHPVDLTVASVSDGASTEETTQLDVNFAAMKINPVKSVGIASWDTKIHIRRPSQKRETVYFHVPLCAVTRK